MSREVRSESPSVPPISSWSGSCRQGLKTAVRIERGMGVQLNLEGDPGQRIPAHPDAPEFDMITPFIRQDVAFGHRHQPPRRIQGRVTERKSVIIAGGDP